MLRFIVLLLLITSPALAEDEPEGVTYSPDYCGFEITFPSQPYTMRKCEDKSEKRCYEEVSFTKVFSINTSIKITAICNTIGDDIYQAYDEEVMKATLKAMTKDNVLETYDLTFGETAEYKQAGLIGQSEQGRTSSLYIAQLWINDSSAFSIEAELIGEMMDKADETFSLVLKSVKPKDVQQPPQQD